MSLVTTLLAGFDLPAQPSLSAGLRGCSSVHSDSACGDKMGLFVTAPLVLFLIYTAAVGGVRDVCRQVVSSITYVCGLPHL